MFYQFVNRTEWHISLWDDENRILLHELKPGQTKNTWSFYKLATERRKACKSCQWIVRVMKDGHLINIGRGEQQNLEEDDKDRNKATIIYKRKCNGTYQSYNSVLSKNPIKYRDISGSIRCVFKAVEISTKDGIGNQKKKKKKVLSIHQMTKQRFSLDHMVMPFLPNKIRDGIWNKRPTQEIARELEGPYNQHSAPMPVSDIYGCVGFSSSSSSSYDDDYYRMSFQANTMFDCAYYS
ncbi:hypothetical protein OROMI_031275 [Orobanche minor]